MTQDFNINWVDDLIWCPSQCYGHIQYKGTDYILYLRWRWEDPWQGHIVKNAKDERLMHHDNTVWSEDIFEKRGLFFTDEELDKAKLALIEIFKAEDVG